MIDMGKKERTMKSKRIGWAVGLVAVAALVSPVTASPANAADTQEYSYLRSFLAEHGASQATQDALVAKVAAGKPLDSDKPGAVPVSAHDESVGTNAVTISTFKDGSVSVSTVERGAHATPGTVSPQAITGCKESNGGGYVVETGCKVEYSTGTYDLWFKASYERYTGGAQIDSVTQPLYVTAHYGSISNKSLAIKRKAADGSLEAYATGHAYFDTGVQSEDLYVSLRVNKSKAYVTNY